MQEIHAKTHRVTVQIHDPNVDGGVVIDVGSITYEDPKDLGKTLAYVLRNWARQFEQD